MNIYILINIRLFPMMRYEYVIKNIFPILNYIINISQFRINKNIFFQYMLK